MSALNPSIGMGVPPLLCIRLLANRVEAIFTT